MGAGENVADDWGRWPSKFILSHDSAHVLRAHVFRMAHGVTTLAWTEKLCQNTQSSTALSLATERAGNITPEVDLSYTLGTI